MIKVDIHNDEKKVKDIVAALLHKRGNTVITIIRSNDSVKVIEQESGTCGPRLSGRPLYLEEDLCSTANGVLYKSILHSIEKPLIERVLKRTEGNQLKAARILGLNRNTIRAKIKKLGIDAGSFKLR